MTALPGARRARCGPAVVVLVLLLVGTVTGCAGGPSSVPSGATPSPAGPTGSVTPGTNPAGPSAATPPVRTSTTVVINDFLYVPEGLTVAAGATVSVDNQDEANHTVTATDGSFDTGNIPGHRKGMFTAPSMPGTYPYKCAIHPFMTGTLTVT